MQDVAVEVPRPLLDCFLSCETNCVRDCCGIDAFTTDAGAIGEWAVNAGNESATKALGQLVELIAAVEDHSHKVELPQPLHLRRKSTTGSPGVPGGLPLSAS